MRIRIRVTVVTIFLMVTAFTAAVAIGLQYHFGQSLAKDAASDLYTTAARAISRQFNTGLEHTARVVQLLAGNPVFEDAAARDQQLAIFRDILVGNELLYGVYVGRSDGSFLELVNLDSSEIARERLRAIPEDRWVVVEVDASGGERRRHFTYLDADM